MSGTDAAGERTPDAVRRLVHRVILSAREAGLDERDPLWPVLMALLALAVKLDRRDASLPKELSVALQRLNAVLAALKATLPKEPPQPFWLRTRIGGLLPGRAWVVAGCVGVAGIVALAFVMGAAHERASLRTAVPRLQAAFAQSGTPGAEAWTSLMQVNDVVAAIQRCEPVPGDAGIPSWRWCRLTLRAPAP